MTKSELEAQVDAQAATIVAMGRNIDILSEKNSVLVTRLAKGHVLHLALVARYNKLVARYNKLIKK